MNTQIASNDGAQSGASLPPRNGSENLLRELRQCGRALRYISNALVLNENYAGLKRAADDALNCSLILKDEEFVYVRTLAENQIMEEALQRIATQHPINDEPLAHCERAATALKAVRELDSPNDQAEPPRRKET